MLYILQNVGSRSNRSIKIRCLNWQVHREWDWTFAISFIFTDRVVILWESKPAGHGRRRQHCLSVLFTTTAQLLLATDLRGTSSCSTVHLSHPPSTKVFIAWNQDSITTADRFLLPWILCTAICYIGACILCHAHTCTVLRSPSVR